MADQKSFDEITVPSTPDSVTGKCESQGFDAAATKRLLRKLDWHLIPFMSLIYLLCFLDRTNIGNARLDHLEQDLKLHGLQYNNCLAILFPFYIASEIPSNIMMKRLRPSVWLTFIIFFWSLAMICQGFVKNYFGLMATRVFLGVFEGGLFPGVNYYIAQWYCRSECGFRMALFFSAASLAGAFGGVLARGIAEMSGVGGKAAWSWIFILEGLASILVAIAAYWCIYDYPSTAEFLKPEERVEVERRLKEDSGYLSNDFDMKYVYQALTDWKIYIFMLICMAGFCPIYSFSMFLPTVSNPISQQRSTNGMSYDYDCRPTGSQDSPSHVQIIKNMGYSANEAQLMSVPPYVCACFFTIVASWYADKLNKRGIFMMAFQVIGIAGFAMLLATSRPSIQYAGTVLAAIGIYPQIPLGMAWNSGNIGGSLKRGTGIAMQVMGGNCGGIIASYVYLSRDSPRFIVGHGILIAIMSMALCLTFFISTWCRLENARRDKITATAGGSQELTEEQKLMEKELADNVPWFRYTV